MKTEGPLTEVPLTDCHPNTIDVTEKANGPKLGFRGSTSLGHKGNDGGGHGLGPTALGLPTVITRGKGLQPSIREGGQLLRPPSVCTMGFTLAEPRHHFPNLCAGDRGQGVVEAGGPGFASLPQLTPGGASIG